MIKICTVLGTRPEIIRLSRIIPKLDQLCIHTLVHTGQNYDVMLTNVFFNEMRIRQPNEFMRVRTTSFGEQIGMMFQRLERMFSTDKPDKMLVLGDTNSGLCSIVAERMGIPVYHMEAGNRCFDKRVPEEINRKIIDSISSYNLPYTQLSKENLLHDGVPKNKIYVTGNPIYEVLKHYNSEIEHSKILKTLHLNHKDFFLATFHRAENVDDHMTLKQIVGGLSMVASTLKTKVICSVHPRTLDKIKKWSVNAEDPNVIFCEPFGFFDFVKLEKEALCIISDSGTVCEEACILKTPNVIIRETTERPEVIECGSSMIVGTSCTKILEGVQAMISIGSDWEIPKEYVYPDVSDRVIKIILGKL